MAVISYVDVVIGVVMIGISISIIFVYFLILCTIYSDKDLMRLTSYRLMLILGIYDIFQCLAHASTGFFTIFSNFYSYTAAKILGVLATPSYISYVTFSLILAINRMFHILSKNIDDFFFYGKRFYIWLGFGFLLWFSFVVALSSPWASIIYHPTEYSWSYDYSLELSLVIKRIEMFIEIAFVSLSALCYLVIVISLGTQRRNFAVGTDRGAEKKILIQASVITLYCMLLNICWHNDTALPSSRITFLILNLMWIGNAAVNPLMYLIVNRTLRSRLNRTAVGMSTVQSLTNDAYLRK